MTLPTTRTYVYTWVALLALLAVTCGSSFLPLGTANVAINIGVAAIKALLVGLVFMRLVAAEPMVRIAAAVGALMLGILAGLSLTDFALRGW
jgi:cytochrome c oxidase subunit 4